MKILYRSRLHPSQRGYEISINYSNSTDLSSVDTARYYMYVSIPKEAIVAAAFIAYICIKPIYKPGRKIK